VTLAEAWDEEARRLPHDAQPDQIETARRIFHAGALAALTSTSDHDAMMCEVLDYARTIGAPSRQPRPRKGHRP
jgi:hypothetical protein